MGAKGKPEQGNEESPPHLVPSWTDMLLSYLPDWMHGHRGDLLYYERTAQQYYRAELRQYEPVLRQRGEMVGEALLSSIFPDGPGSRSTTERVSYSDVVADSIAEGPMRNPLRHLVWSVEPLLAPVLNPFVE